MFIYFSNDKEQSVASEIYVRESKRLVWKKVDAKIFARCRSMSKRKAHLQSPATDLNTGNDAIKLWAKNSAPA